MPGEPPTVTLRRLVNGYQVTQAIHVAAVLGIADLLADGTRSSDDLAAASGAHAPSLHRVLRALASIGVLHEADDGRFSLTEVGHCLRSDAPDPVGGWAAYVGGHAHFAAWGNLLQAVRTGESAFRSVHGADVWEYRARHPEDGARFDQAMTDNTRQTNRRLLEAYDFGPLRSVIDVGGGHGALLGALLSAYPQMRGVLFDLPHVVAGAAVDAARLRGRRRELLRCASAGRRCLRPESDPPRLGGRGRCAHPAGVSQRRARACGAPGHPARPRGRQREP
jgi:hypothetical protein